jgi:NAD(P)-dependent dehydrogenase (short-subunit alcohol dehydrogenase family)
MAERVLITGCSRGIGLALATEFAQARWEVFAGARGPRRRELTALAEKWANLKLLSLDVCDQTTVAKSARLLEGRCLDILVNNAATFPGEGHESLEEVDPEWFNDAFNCNVTGVARVTRAFLPHLKASSHARVANISSGAGSISEKEDFDYYPYSVSKAALNMLTRALAAEFRPMGIVVAAISPGWVKTEMGGPNAPLTPQESARSLFRTITGLKMEQSGKFLGRNNESYSW